jgi:hypothetical protein
VTGTHFNMVRIGLMPLNKHSNTTMKFCLNCGYIISNAYITIFVDIQENTNKNNAWLSVLKCLLLLVSFDNI